MITRTYKDNTLSALIELHEDTLMVVYPCGSRFFGDAADNSDFDFFIEADELNTNKLLARGWERGQQEYHDVNTIELLHKGKETVITVLSVKHRLAVQQYIIDNHIVRKKGNIDFWNKLYNEVCGVPLPGKREG